MEKAANINCGLPNCIKEVPAKASNAIQASALASVSDGTGALRLSSTATAPERPVAAAANTAASTAAKPTPIFNSDQSIFGGLGCQGAFFLCRM